MQVDTQNTIALSILPYRLTLNSYHYVQILNRLRFSEGLGVYYILVADISVIVCVYIYSGWYEQ